MQANQNSDQSAEKPLRHIEGFPEGIDGLTDGNGIILNKIDSIQSFSTKSSSAIRYENTYRMEPMKKFFPDKVAAIIKSVLEEAIGEKEYDFELFSSLTSELSDHIKEKVKESLDIPRYKLVSFVMAGQLKDQGARVGSRCVWNAAFDHYATSSYKNRYVFAVGVVYAVYFE